ncbi:aspartate aminotransferase family protein [Elioraea thermophila]|uniref:aspartate aminotransferase family protein n=1 Tax=Elioraea thermophila TaxID=2185104 RepID=UPI000DF25E60|nr:aspartate aminotransferase family protein [Elioraea thermophila]
MTARPKTILEMNAFRGGEAHDLLARRLANTGAATVLFYRDPLVLVRGRGAWVEAADGRRFLDAYNNVFPLGHAHPRVVAALARQAGEIAINSRYLNETTERYLERLKATLPAALENVVLVCTGSEANDLALRIARAATGRQGVIVTETAYHGNTAAVTEISPASWKRGGPPPFVRLVPAPSAAHSGDDVATGFAQAIALAARSLEEAGYGLASFICDTVFSSDGVHVDPPGFLAPAVAMVRRHGGLFVADEVQPGFGRTGQGMWGFARHGVVPDVVTMGKPMGNGYPMAAVATRHELLAALCERAGYFNTFAATPVAAAVGNAVLDVLEEEGLIANAARRGHQLKAGLLAMAQRSPLIAAVRGAGLFIGVELAGDDAPARVEALVDALRERGVLVGAAGRYGETVKIRPPLCLSEEEAGFFLDAFGDALAAVAQRALG